MDNDPSMFPFTGSQMNRFPDGSSHDLSLEAFIDTSYCFAPSLELGALDASRSPHDETCVDDPTCLGTPHSFHRGAPHHQQAYRARHNTIQGSYIFNDFSASNMTFHQPSQLQLHPDIRLSAMSNQPSRNVFAPHTDDWMGAASTRYTATNAEDDACSVAESSKYCNSMCSVGEPCTNNSCDGVSECNQDCVPCEATENCEANAAAQTLASIGVVQEPESMDFSSITRDSTGHLGLDGQRASSQGGAPDDLQKHMWQYHYDQGLESCDGPCLLTNYDQCPFPLLDAYYPLEGTQFDLSTNHDPFNNPAPDHLVPPSNSGWHSCGEKFSDPDHFLNHIFQTHRELFSPEGVPNPSMSLSASPQRQSRTSYSSRRSQSHLSTPSISPFPTTPSRRNSALSEGFSDVMPSFRPLSSPVPASRPRTPQTILPGQENMCHWLDGKGDHCGKNFDTADELHNHCLNTHLKHMPRSKDGCFCRWSGCARGDGGGTPFPQHSKLARHLQTHTGYKPATCDICNQSFSAQQALEQHKLTHTNMKPMACTWPGCTKTFKQKSALTMHIRTHTGDKPLKCPICDKRFSESSNLSKHKRTHGEAKDFVCSEEGCSRRFVRKDQLRRHMKVHARERNGSTDSHSGLVTRATI